MQSRQERLYHDFGRLGEEHVTNELLRRGYAAEWIGETCDYDILVDGKARVEVKSATCTPGSGGIRWQFSLRRHNLLVDEDLLFLVCWTDDLESDPLAIFVIPGSAIPERLTKIDITSHPTRYRGKWAVYRNAWHLVDEILETLPEGQLAIDDMFRVPEEIEIPF